MRARATVGRMLSAQTLPSPLGPLLAVASPRGLCTLAFVDGPSLRSETGSYEAEARARLARWFPREPIVDKETRALVDTRRWLDRYFAGAAPRADEIALDLRGTDFEIAVWRALCEIPPGATTSYGAVGAAVERSLNKPKVAARAVGGAVGRNPIGLVVPCHRVVGSDGSMVGYGAGLSRKRWLLSHEAPATLTLTPP